MPSHAAVVGAVLLWALLDVIYPYHSGLLLKIHPVHTCYVMARRLHSPGAGSLYGAALVAACLTTHLLPYSLALYLVNKLPYGDVPWALTAAWCLKVSVSPTLLIKQVREVGERLLDGDLRGARAVAQGLVRRDLSSANSHHVASAAIESLAESLVDGVVSPLFWFTLLGPLGALLQRLVNTLDGAVGFKDPEHLREGRVAAYLDTAMNYVPARMTAALLVFLAPLTGLSLRGALTCWLRYSGVTESLNAGHPMASAAGALGVWLEKLDHYVIPCGPAPGGGDVITASKLAVTATITSVAASTALALLGHFVWPPPL